MKRRAAVNKNGRKKTARDECERCNKVLVYFTRAWRTARNSARTHNKLIFSHRPVPANCMHRSNSSESFVVSNFESESDDASVVTDSQPTPLSASNESSSKLSTEQTLVADLQQTIDLVNSYFRNDVGTQYAVEIVNKTPRQTTSRSFTFETNTHKLVVRVEDTGTSSATEHASSTSSTSSSLARRLRRRLRRPKRVLDSDSSLSSDSRPGSKPVPSGTTRKRPKTKTNRRMLEQFM